MGTCYMPAVLAAFTSLITIAKADVPYTSSPGLLLVQTRAQIEGQSSAKLAVSVTDSGSIREHKYPVRGRLNISAEQTWPVHVSDDLDLSEFSAMFVQTKEKSTVVILSKYSEKVLNISEAEPYECVFENGQKSSIRVHGKTDSPYAKAIQWGCDVPNNLQPHLQECQDVRLQLAGAEGSSNANKLTVCNDANAVFTGDDYYLSACAPIPYEDPDHLSKSGFVQLPQWLEYNAMHGVEHFLFYILVDHPEHKERMMSIAQPYLDAGLGSVVEVVGFRDVGYGWNRDHALLANDCLYRMKHRTHWLMATIDSDEYLHVEGHDSLAEALRSAEEKADGPIHSISFPRYQFMFPNDEGVLHISEHRRENKFANLCPKYILQPANTFTAFIHWTNNVKKGSKAITTEDIWGAHYRLNEQRVQDQGINLVDDMTLVAEVDNLKRKLAERYGTERFEGLVLDHDISYSAEIRLRLESTGAHRRAIIEWVAKVNERMVGENRSACVAVPGSTGSRHWACEQGVGFKLGAEDEAAVFA